MDVLVGDAKLRPGAAGAVTIGNFDGVHLGHQALLEDLSARAAAGALVPAVVTFDPHPASVLHPGTAPPLLAPLAFRLELLERAGVGAVLVVRFDKARAEERAEDFVDEVLVRQLRARLVLVGADFRFGHRRLGDVALLRTLGRQSGFEVGGVPLVDRRGPVSSTRVRRLLAGGGVEEAAELLGRPHEVRGTVVHGDGRGRLLGFPTANIDVQADYLVPGDGVYAGELALAGGAGLRTVVSVGRRPTFYDSPSASLAVEAHVLDFAGDLYGQSTSLRFVAKLRDQETFVGEGELVAQMRRDAGRAADVLAAGVLAEPERRRGSC